MQGNPVYYRLETTLSEKLFHNLNNFEQWYFFEKITL